MAPTWAVLGLFIFQTIFNLLFAGIMRVHAVFPSNNFQLALCRNHAGTKKMGLMRVHGQNSFCAGFFGFVRLFCNFFNVSKRSLHFFLLCKRMDVQTPKGPLFTFFVTMRLTEDQKNRKKIFEKFRIFFNFFLTREL